MLKLFLAFLGIAALTLAGAVLLLVWIAGQTPIRVTEGSEPVGAPLDPGELLGQGAVLAVHGEVTAVGPAEWTTSDGSRPGTPWGISGVPDENWIQTPIVVSPADRPVDLRPEISGELAFPDESGELIVAVRGGEIGADRYLIEDGRDRDFAEGDEVLLILTVAGEDLSDPALFETGSGPGWEFMRRYSVQDDTAVLAWGDEMYEWPLADRLEAYRQAAR